METLASLLNAAFQLPVLLAPVFVLLVGVGSLVVVMWHRSKGLPLSNQTRTTISILSDVSTIVAGVIVLDILLRMIGSLYTALGSAIAELLTSPGVVLWAFPIACILYRFRLRHQFWYGFLECFVALFAMHYPTKTDQTPALKIIAILGGIYIFVRGLDNMSKRPPAWLPNRFKRWLT